MGLSVICAFYFGGALGNPDYNNAPFPVVAGATLETSINGSTWYGLSNCTGSNGGSFSRTFALPTVQTESTWADASEQMSPNTAKNSPLGRYFRARFYASDHWRPDGGTTLTIDVIPQLAQPEPNVSPAQPPTPPPVTVPTPLSAPKQ